MTATGERYDFEPAFAIGARRVLGILIYTAAFLAIMQMLGVSGAVSEQQMKALFGEGRHPNADAIEASVIAGGGSVKDAERASRLGRRPYKYDSSTSEIGQRIQSARDAQEIRLGRELSVDEIRQTRMRVASDCLRTASINSAMSGGLRKY